MDVVVVGAGPVGIVGSIALARAGHPVTLVDRDPGPAGPVWERRGVMQFMAPHFFRPQVRDVLDAVVPEAWPALLAAGAVPGTPPGAPDGVSTLSARRSTVERVLWTLARREPGVRPLTGHADRVLVEGGRAAGVMVDGHRLAADVVVCAAGRASRLAED
ncbi:MAG: NAD(P)/FAD-dependent oxidoreductase, partial [Motilibacteraceae bacterium]